ncbi:hypothetical protein dqs_0628 [Azoarcus olearius]|uniref:phage tail terminator protein n=1 Tax=Azoarcus sp. (strain BH72) TaxID=418699 RepID=UPI000806336F|nr:hypothetical protein [Azoarcus olearius]ANQ83704.1 hypothetical protein dqs_0628 [Azoarcus olearius]
MLDRDWLAAGPHLVERLRDQVREFRLVAELTDLGKIEERVKQAPAGIVAYDGTRYADGARSGMSRQGAQRWMVVVAVRNATGGGDNSALAAEAGPLILRVSDALSGWAPFEGRPLREVTAPRPGYSTAFAYYPLMFELDFVTATPRR